MNKLLFLLLFNSVMIHLSVAQDKSVFMHYSVEEGLSQSSVSALATDRDGFLWIGTQDGLNRFNGYEFDVFRNKALDTTSLKSNYITELLFDKKDNLWIGTLNSGLNYLDKCTGKFKNIQLNHQEERHIGNNNITALQVDNFGNLWVGTLSGVKKVSISSQKIIEIEDQMHFDLKDQKITALLVDSHNKLWISTTNSIKIYQISNSGNIELKDEVKEVSNTLEALLRQDKNLENELTFSSIAEDRDGNIIFVHSNAIISYSIKTLEAEVIKLPVGDEELFSTIHIDVKGNYWIGTNEKLYSLEKKGSEFQSIEYENNPDDPESIFIGSKVSRITEDLEGNIWVGAWAGGLNRYSDSENLFNDIRTQDPAWNVDKDLVVTGLHVDEDQSLWLGTFGDGIFKSSPSSASFENIYPKKNNSFAADFSNVTHIDGDKEGNIWITSHGGGLGRISDTKKSVIPIRFPIISTRAQNFDNQMFSFSPNTDELWISSFQAGLLKLQVEDKSHEIYRLIEDDSTSISDNRPREIYQDSDGRLWITSNGGGLNLYNEATNSFRRFLHSKDHEHSVPSNIVNTITESADGNLWLGTYNGIAKIIDIDKGIFQRYSHDLPSESNVICAIEEDKYNRLWVSTFSGILCFDPKNGNFIDYGNADGISNQEFNTRSSAQNLSTGEIYFGGQKTCTFFQPNDFTSSTTNSKLVISKMTIHDSSQKKDVKSHHYFVKSDSTYRFTYLNKILNFSLTGLSYQETDQLNYQYKLEGFDDLWHDVSENREIIFTNLDAGSYTLLGKVANRNKQWSEDQKLLTFTISPPWYFTYWAYASYLLLFCLLTYFVYRFNLSKKLAEENSKRLKELDEFKSNFYSNITHEFRTPLTVIMGMSEKIKESIETNTLDHLREDVLPIDRNARRLLQLINQILNLSRLDYGNFNSNFIHGNVNVYIKDVVREMQAYASSKELALIFYAEQKEIMMDYDIEIYYTILSNLISNAIKNTEQGGEIIVHSKLEHSKNEKLILKIRDNGKGIPEDQLPTLFSRFSSDYDSRGNSIGIGLALTKQFVLHLEGTIKVVSSVGKGTEFTIELPISKEAELAEAKLKKLHIGATVDEEVVTSIFTEGLPTLLLIEDNTEIANYIIKFLSPNYNVRYASNGEDGIKIANESTPDLIICDIIMEGMDGFSVCKNLKDNKLTRSIPIIMLTAKAEEKDRILGISMGADAYLTKPFSKIELITRIKKLLERATSSTIVSPKKTLESFINKKYSEPDSILIQEATKAILENIENEIYGSAMLARTLKISESQLYRKLKSIRGQSTALFIRSVRIEKAHQMILSTDLSISEIAKLTGFKSSSWFSKAFKQEMGFLPSDIKNKF